MKTLWYAIVRLFLSVYTGRPYQWRNKLYRWVWEREFKAVPIPVFHSLEAIFGFIKPEKWVSDSWKSLGDGVSYPGKAQLVFDGKLTPTSDFDCDDFASWTTAALRNSTVQALDITHASVYWAEGWKLSGHAVCLFLWANRYWTMDYYKPRGPFMSRTEAARWVCHQYGGDSATPIAFALHGADLELVEFNSL